MTFGLIFSGNTRTNDIPRGPVHLSRSNDYERLVDKEFWA